MITRRELNVAFGATLAAFLSATVAGLHAEPAPQQDSHQNMSNPPRGITPLMHESIGDIGDADALMSILTLQPKFASPPHHHSGPVFAYVLEGSVENQVEPEQPKTYSTGEYWYEPAMHTHRVFHNPSETQQARVLVFQLMPKNKPAAPSAK